MSLEPRKTENNKTGKQGDLDQKKWATKPKSDEAN